ncbi:MAG: UDP-N-acetylglucosamine 2-epimerase (non-hydrolyzing), partial [Candidatus Omnitrophota bacterium]
MKKIVVVAGARPNFIKIAILMKKLKLQKRIETTLVHTGQHYDYKMSEIFFQELNIPKPDIFLNTKPGSLTAQASQIMQKFEKILARIKPDLVVVVGDVNSTLACALTASHLRIKVAHIESGLRSFDKEMPEENNRILTDHLSDYLFVSEKSGIQNLKNEGIDSKKIHFVGNIMIDALRHHKKIIDQSNIVQDLGVKQEYCVLTLHRPGNVDAKNEIKKIKKIIGTISKQVLVVFPLHPRTKKMLLKHGYFKTLKANKNLLLCDPMGYIDFVKLMKESKFVMTDSGGMQEECTILHKPCLTLRPNTERPITVTLGTNRIVGLDMALIDQCAQDIV